MAKSQTRESQRKSNALAGMQRSITTDISAASLTVACVGRTKVAVGVPTVTTALGCSVLSTISAENEKHTARAQGVLFYQMHHGAARTSHFFRHGSA